MVQCPRKMAAGRKIRRWTTPLVAALLAFWATIPLPAFSQITKMEDADLAEVTAHGFSEFSLVDGVATARFAIKVSTYAEIDSLKMGYYDNGAGVGWDQDWTNVKMGNPVEDLVFNGLYIRAEFANYDDPVNRRLLSLRIGTDDLRGTMSADFNTFSGEIAAGTPTSGSRQNPAFNQITSENSGFFFNLELAGPNKGFSVHFDQATAQ